MDQRKIGAFLKELRKGTGITQEQLAEKLNVSNRAVSRWETGSNLPDLDVLMELADFYDVEIGEILDGERKSEKMTEETRDSVHMVAEYANEEKTVLLRRVRVISIIGLAALMSALFMLSVEPESPLPVFSFVEGLSIGLSIGAMVTMVLYTMGMLAKARSKKTKKMKMIAIVCLCVVLLSLVASIIASIV